MLKMMHKHERRFIIMFNKGLRNGVLFVLPWVALVACLRGRRAGVGAMGSVLALNVECLLLK